MNKKLHIGWGVSFLVDDKILFDAGEKGKQLLENMRSLGVDLGVDIDKIEAIVISHDHWDHWGGLWDLLQSKKGIRVYICPNFSREFKDKANKLGASLVEVERLTQIVPNVFLPEKQPVLIMAVGKGPLHWFIYVAIFLFLFLAVWIPCCVSDIVFPLLFIRESKGEKWLK